MDKQRKYLIFKIILRFIATGCVILGWILASSVLFWAGVVITVFSFFL